MIRRPRVMRLSGTVGASGGDTDTLQTDVMRFMSIIGLCLMAVFALVQGLPMQETGKVPTQVQRWRALLQAQQLQLSRLTDDLQSLQADKHALQQTLVTAEAHARQARATARQQQQRTRQLETRLATLEAQLVEARQVIDAAERQQSLSQRTRIDLETRLEETQVALDDSRASLAELQRDRAIAQASPSVIPAPRVPETQTREEEIPEPEKSEPEKPESQQPEPQQPEPGFRLQFASDAALDALVTQGAVRLFALTDLQTWQATRVGGQVALVDHPSPRWYHEMATATVPAHYRTRLAAQQTDRDTAVTWGVQLPDMTRQRLQALTRGREGGTLVIGADGQVELQGERHD